jgi:hypothetical protein
MALLSELIDRDTYANRPAAGTEGALFYATDYGILYRDNGSTWDAMLDINSLSSNASPDSDNDYAIIYDAGTGKLQKVLLSNMPGGGAGGAPDDAEYVVATADGDLSGEIVIPSMAGHPDIKPSSPNTEDDEFDSSSLDVKWTETINTANASDIDTTWKSWIFVDFTGDQAYQIDQDYAPGAATAFSITVKGTLAPSANYGGLLLACRNAGDTETVRAQIAYNSSSGDPMKFQLDTQDAGSYTFARKSITMPRVNTVYIHLQRDASDNWRAWISIDGLAFYPCGTVYNKSFTVAAFNIALNQQGSTSPMRCGIDWVRRDWITL